MGNILSTGERCYSGLAASGGVVLGKILRLGPRQVEVRERKITAAEVEPEMCRLREALLNTRQQIREIQRRVSAALGAKEAAIFDAHVLVLDDPTLIEEVTRSIQVGLLGAESAVHSAASRFSAALEAVQDPFLRERSVDVRDVTQRLMLNLEGGPSADLGHLT
ncbi:MAG TPA: phosphoenolpyruvate-utilizing N-terminal domain-containing protein, partial [Verrucomicrobiota bacterium]|nr:phosphoenolpyruvate-utilizing N-terminal domain-containing protein [Verrucomicrobiota bacterium]